MHLPKHAAILIAIPTLLMGIGCATICGTPLHTMPIHSMPSDADVVIKDEDGKEIFKGKTPTTVSLQKSTGKYFGKKTYTVNITKDGFESASVQVTAEANGWYIGGNIVFGGLIGWLVVDPQSGKMYNMSPENINATLKQKTIAPAAPSTALSVITIDKVPQESLHLLNLVAAK